MLEANVWQFNHDGFMRMVEELCRLSGQHFDVVLTSLVGQILKSTIQRTPARKPGEIIKRVSKNATYIEFADGTKLSKFKKNFRGDDNDMYWDRSTWNGRGKPPRVEDGRAWHNMGHRFGALRWSRYQAAKAERPRVLARKAAEAVAARGLAKKTWWEMCEALGLPPSMADDYVRNAKAPGGKVFREAFIQKMFQDGAMFIQLTNSNPIFGKLNGRRILERAIDSKVKAFEIDASKGVFETIKQRARRYPGIFSV